jgi:hypothetical protein
MSFPTATITAQGVAPETAITGLNQALVSILKPTSEATNLSRQLGIDFSEAGLRSKGLAGFLEQVSTATGGSASKLTTLFGSVDALKAILPLLSGDMQKFVENILKQDQAAGVASKAFNEMSATLEGALKMAKEQGAKKLTCIGIHGLLLGDSAKRIRKYAKLITTNTIAEQVAIWVLGEYKKRFLYEINWRGNPALECSDIVTVEDDFSEDKTVRLTRNEFNFDGTLRAKTLGKGGG